MSSGQEKMDAMNKIIFSGDISESKGNKEAYASASKSFLEQLLKDIDEYLSISVSRVSFNPVAPKDAGVPSLKVMTINGKGVAVYILIPPTGQSNVILYHNIFSMESFSDIGNNYWLDANTPYGTVVDKIAAIAM